jgi:hypothetical protein
MPGGGRQEREPETNAMMEGFLEFVSDFQAQGWACDPEDLEYSVVVELSLNGAPIGTATASLYRQDLEQAGLGSGRHAFVFNTDAPLSADARQKLEARAIDAAGVAHPLSRLAHRVTAEPAQKAGLPVRPVSVDESQRPVFILGAARSGTSAVAQALLKLGFEGHQEGHFFDLIAHLNVAWDRFYALKGDELSRDTMVSRIPFEFVEALIDSFFIEAAAAAFPSRRWLDKTPNSDMIHIAPRLRRLWPNARFIFMKRRFLENTASRARKFPQYSFERNCIQWSDAMAAWLATRDKLAGAALEIDQKVLQEKPADVAKAIARLVELPPGEADKLAQYLANDWPERTSRRADQAALRLDDLAWSKEERNVYERLAKPMMQKFGWSEEGDYYAPGQESNAIRMI